MLLIIMIKVWERMIEQGAVTQRKMRQKRKNRGTRAGLIRFFLVEASA